MSSGTYSFLLVQGVLKHSANKEVPADGGSGHPFPICLRADYPFPPRDLGPVYFEITILHAEHTPASDLGSPTVTLGFCGEFCDLTMAHPGWNAWSVGYHGDDGLMFEEHPLSGFRTGCKFGPGNTVGCGIDYASEEYFFTLDGTIVGTSPPRSVSLHNREMLTEEPVQTVACHARSYPGSCTRVLVTVQRHAMSR